MEVEVTKVKDLTVIRALALGVELEVELQVEDTPGLEAEVVTSSPFRSLSPSRNKNEDIGQPTVKTPYVVPPNTQNLRAITHVQAVAKLPLGSKCSYAKQLCQIQ